MVYNSKREQERFQTEENSRQNMGRKVILRFLNVFFYWLNKCVCSVSSLIQINHDSFISFVNKVFHVLFNYFSSAMVIVLATLMSDQGF